MSERKIRMLNIIILIVVLFLPTNIKHSYLPIFQHIFIYPLMYIVYYVEAIEYSTFNEIGGFFEIIKDLLFMIPIWSILILVIFNSFLAYKPSKKLLKRYRICIIISLICIWYVIIRYIVIGFSPGDIEPWILMIAITLSAILELLIFWRRDKIEIDG